MKTAIPKIPLARLLSLSKAQFLSHVPLSLRPNHLAVGALIFKPSPITTTTTNPLLLLLKRAAHDPAFPNLFAVPGGHVESTDLTLLHSLEREVLEETSLRVQRVVDQIDALAWATTKLVRGDAKVAVESCTSLQLIFVCEVGVETTVRVDREEHSVGCWVDGEEAGRLDMSGGMRRVVEDAFRWRDGVGRRERGGGGKV